VSLVGAYLRYGEQCDFVVYGTQTEGQGEIDVIGFQVEQQLRREGEAGAILPITSDPRASRRIADAVASEAL
jgi:hypothetical protein